MAHKQCPILFFLPHLSCRGVWRYTLITHHMGLTQIDLINQIYYFLLRFPRFLRETTNPLADCADAAERYMGLTQIDLINQIYYFPLRVPRFLRETPLPLADGADAAERYMGLTQIDLINQIYYFLLRFLRFLRETTNPLADTRTTARAVADSANPRTKK